LLGGTKDGLTEAATYPAEHGATNFAMMAEQMATTELIDCRNPRGPDEREMVHPEDTQEKLAEKRPKGAGSSIATTPPKTGQRSCILLPLTTW
jgi:hypothetical protein